MKNYHIHVIGIHRPNTANAVPTFDTIHMVTKIFNLFFTNHKMSTQYSQKMIKYNKEIPISQNADSYYKHISFSS